MQRYNDLTVFKMAAVRHLGLRNSNFSTVWVVKRHIFNNYAKLREDRSIHCCDIAIFVIFQVAAAAISVLEKLKILTISPL